MSAIISARQSGEMGFEAESRDRSRLYGYDLNLLFPVLLLVGIGVVMVYSASSALAIKKFGSDVHFLKKQAFFSVIGIILMLSCRHLSMGFLKRISYPLLALSLVMLVMVHISAFGLSAGGATRWLRLGRISFQPSEVARLALVIYLACSMSRKLERLDDFYIGFLPHAIVLAMLSLLILMQPDFGSVVILGAITWSMMYVGGARLKHLLLSLAALAPMTYIFLVVESYRIERIIAFFDPWRYAQDGGYQIIHSLMAFGSGGVWGKGIGQGYQKLFYLPEPHTDFIFSVVGEELGLAGVLIILALYGIIIYRGMSIARRTSDYFASLLAAGITLALGLQVTVNIGVSLALLPTKGLTLPFLSYGGTSLLLNMAAIGMLMAVGASESR